MLEKEQEKVWEMLSFVSKVNSNEVVYMVTRRHIVLILLKSMTYFAVFLVLYVMRTFMQSVIDDSLTIALFDTIMYGVGLTLILAFMVSFHNYFLSVQVVTNERIIDVDQVGLFRREVNEITINNIQNVNYKQNGALALMFDFGDVVVESSGEDPSHKVGGFIFDKVPNPKGVMDRIGQVYNVNERCD